jgi:hypothetical protein
VLANAFQETLEGFSLTEKILALNADNATANDKQTSKLSTLENSFEEENRVRCFNHTIQLSAKALLTPFNAALSRKGREDSPEIAADSTDDIIILGADQEDEDDADDADDEDEDVEDRDDEDDDIDELQELSEGERDQMLEDTAVVRETVSKVLY